MTISETINKFFSRAPIVTTLCELEKASDHIDQAILHVEAAMKAARGSTALDQPDIYDTVKWGLELCDLQGNIPAEGTVELIFLNALYFDMEKFLTKLKELREEYHLEAITV